jgi:urea transport system ATP-binding protein
MSTVMESEIAQQANQREQWESEATIARLVQPGELDLSHRVILYLDDITVSFDGFRALSKLSLAIDAGELRCIIGPNGAGKTTMMDVITGKTRPDAGKAFFGQTMDLTRMSEAEIAHAGIGRKFQKPTVFEQHTVFENLELAMKADKRVRCSLFARLSSEEGDRIAAVLERIRLAGAADRTALGGKVTVLHEGSVLAEGPLAAVQDDPRVIEVYLGR